MEQCEMGQQGLGELARDTFRGVTLEELDKHVQDHEQDVLKTYLGWLQEQLNDWDLSETAVFRPQIESWCASLRFHGFDDQTIFDAFAVWKTKEIDQNASSARRFLVAEDVLLEVLSLNQAIGQSRPEVEQGRESVITVRDNRVIDVSSGAEDSDVEFLGWKGSNNSTTGYPRRFAAKQEKHMRRTAYDDHNAGLNSSRSKKKSGNRQRRGPLHKDYVCIRCKEKGHHVEDCPTNLDPTYDRPPEPGFYICYCCGAYRKHLTTLCPRNQNPDSLTQQRIRAGIITGEPSTPVELDRYLPAYGNSRKRHREPSVDANAIYTYEFHRASMELDDDVHMNPERRALLERTRRSSQSEFKTGSNRSSYRSVPPSKRPRNRGERQHEDLRERDRRKSHKSHMPRGQSPSIGSEYGGPTELLPQVIHHSSDTAGRLSPWNDGYGDSKMSQPTSSSSRTRPVASEFWRSDSPDTTIQLLFPRADATWVSDMTSFDADRFFDELDDFMENRVVARYSEETQVVLDLNLGDSGLTLGGDEGEGQVKSKTGSNQTHGVDMSHLDYDDLGMHTGLH